MTVTIADVEGATLTGTAQVEEWKTEFEREFYAPMLKMMERMLWARLDARTRTELERMTPGLRERMAEDV